MPLEGVPWFIDHADHGPEIARLLAYMSTGRGEGVVNPTDCKLVASAIPDGNVHLTQGALAVRNRFPGGDSQSYLVRSTGDTVLGLPAQGSGGGRYDLVAVVVEDPQYPGQPAPVSVADGPYVRLKRYANVPSTTKRLSEIDPNQSGYAVGLVHFDASDGTVTNGDIIDLRNLVLPRTHIEKKVVNAVGTTNLPAAAATMPPEAEWNIEVPEWATRVIIEADIASLQITDTSSGTGYATGYIRGRLGSIVTEGTVWRGDGVGTSKAITLTIFAAEDKAVPEAMRGTTQELACELWRTALVTMTAATNSYTAAKMTATFYEGVE